MIRAVCPWCRLFQVIARPRVHCPNCGHRADVARLYCDCPACATPGKPRPAYPPPPPNVPELDA